MDWKVLLMQAFQTAALVHPLCGHTGCAFGKTAFAYFCLSEVFV